MAIEVYYLFILFIFQESKSKKVGLLIKALIKEFPLCSTSFYIYFCNYLDLYQLEFIWTLFQIYDSCILFEFMIKYLFFE